MQILCVCTGNTCRSPMLATLLRQALVAAEQPQISVVSAGVAAGDGQPASTAAQQVMHERQLDLSNHRSQPVTSELIASSDFAVCMGPHHAAALEQLGMPSERIAIAAAEQGGVPDPFGGPVEIYRQTADVLSHVVDDIISGITNAAQQAQQAQAQQDQQDQEAQPKQRNTPP